jgi:hypothetical protein
LAWLALLLAAAALFWDLLIIFILICEKHCT